MVDIMDSDEEDGEGERDEDEESIFGFFHVLLL
jgi:hypothetical protein